MIDIFDDKKEDNRVIISKVRSINIFDMKIATRMIASERKTYDNTCCKRLVFDWGQIYSSGNRNWKDKLKRLQKYLYWLL